MPTPSTSLTMVPSLVLVALLCVACGGAEQTSEPRGAEAAQPSSRSAPAPPPSGRVSGDETGEPAQTQENRRNISITIGDHAFGATLEDSPAARDLTAQLPVTVRMIDHGGAEKTGPLPRPLSPEGQPAGADPDVGDLGYYAPDHNLVVYYGDQSYFPGIVILGRLDGDAAQRIADTDGTVTATVEAR